MDQARNNRDADFLLLADEALLAQCDVDTYRSSGPGGQHRNKVSSAVRLRHRPSGVAAHGDESRSQHDNKRMAVRRLRMNIACTLRRTIDVEADLPEVVASCTFRPRGRGADAPGKLDVGRRDRRFWPVAAYVLDALDAFDGRMSDAAAREVPEQRDRGPPGHLDGQPVVLPPRRAPPARRRPAHPPSPRPGGDTVILQHSFSSGPKGR